MKKSEIVIGGRYRNKSGSVREVVAIGPEYAMFRGQYDTDNLRYKLVVKGKGGCAGLQVGQESNCTRASFASWAVERVL